MNVVAKTNFNGVMSAEFLPRLDEACVGFMTLFGIGRLGVIARGGRPTPPDKLERL
jgi:hypothetical protein